MYMLSLKMEAIAGKGSKVKQSYIFQCEYTHIPTVMLWRR